jgi:hypothetical protein
MGDMEYENEAMGLQTYLKSRDAILTGLSTHGLAPICNGLTHAKKGLRHKIRSCR